MVVIGECAFVNNISLLHSQKDFRQVRRVAVAMVTSPIDLLF